MDLWCPAVVDITSVPLRLLHFSLHHNFVRKRKNTIIINYKFIILLQCLYCRDRVEKVTYRGLVLPGSSINALGDLWRLAVDDVLLVPPRLLHVFLASQLDWTILWMYIRRWNVSQHGLGDSEGIANWLLTIIKICNYLIYACTEFTIIF